MDLKEKFISYCKQDIHRDGIDDLLAWLEKSDFYIAPASTRFHGNYAGGLCEHSINVYEQLLRLHDLYGGNIASRETLAIVSLFHDVCKINYYKQGSRNVKDENGNWITKAIWEVDEKVPLGHGEKSCIILQQYFKLTIDELLAIRWHMSGFDAAVKGGDYSLSKAQDASKLVSLLSVADILSSNLLEETRK